TAARRAPRTRCAGRSSATRSGCRTDRCRAGRWAARHAQRSVFGARAPPLAAETGWRWRSAGTRARPARRGPRPCAWQRWPRQPARPRPPRPAGPADRLPGRAAGAARLRQPKLPCLRNKASPRPAVVPLLGDLYKPVADIQVAGCQKLALRPQSDAAVTGGAGKAQQLLDQSLSDPQPARARLDQKQPQLADRRPRADEKDTAHRLTVLLGDPAPLAPGIEARDEVGDDA